MKNHIARIHDKNKNHKCDSCDKRFYTKPELNDHILNNHVDDSFQELKCPYCEKGWNHKYKMEKHIRTVHVGVKEFQCEICPNSFATYCSLKKHENSKHMVKNDVANAVIESKLKCTICLAKFKLQNNLSNHMTIHKDKTFQCEICIEKFRSKKSITEHIARLHADNSKHIKCDSCEKTFVVKHELRRHVMLKHLGIPQHLCNICNQELYSASQLRLHIRIKHEGKIEFECDICKKFFTSLYNLKPLKQHKKKMHKAQEPKKKKIP